MDERLLAAIAAYIDEHYEAEREVHRLHIDDLRTIQCRSSECLFGSLWA